jgi:hypothetical protein
MKHRDMVGVEECGFEMVDRHNGVSIGEGVLGQMLKLVPTRL